MGLTTADTASPSRGSLHYLHEQLPQRDAKFAKLNDKYIQRKEFVTSLKARLAGMKSQFAASRSDFDVLQAANDDLLKNRGTDRKELSTLRSQVFQLETELQAFRALPSDLADAVLDRDCYIVLLQSLAAQFQGLQAGCANIVRRAQGIQAFLRDVLCSLLKEFKPPSLG